MVLKFVQGVGELALALVDECKISQLDPYRALEGLPAAKHARA
jgi:hypothetical protein